MKMNAPEGYLLAPLALDDVQPNALTELFIAGTRLLLSRVEGKIVAFASRCPHASASFIDGEIARHKLFCPSHGYCFDVRNGRILYPADEPYLLKRYAVVIQEARIWVKVD